MPSRDQAQCSKDFQCCGNVLMLGGVCTVGRGGGGGGGGGLGWQT